MILVIAKFLANAHAMPSAEVEEQSSVVWLFNESLGCVGIVVVAPNGRVVMECVIGDTYVRLKYQGQFSTLSRPH